MPLKAGVEFYVRFIRNAENEYFLTEFVVYNRKMVKMNVRKYIENK